MPEQFAFALKEGVDDFADGAFSLGPSGETFQVGAALKDGGGYIVTDDPAVAELLTEFDALRRVPASAVPQKRSTRRAGAEEE